MCPGGIDSCFTMADQASRQRGERVKEIRKVEAKAQLRPGRAIKFAESSDVYYSTRVLAPGNCN